MTGFSTSTFNSWRLCQARTFQPDTIVLLADLVLRPLTVTVVPWPTLLKRAALNVAGVIGTVVIGRFSTSRRTVGRLDADAVSVR